MPKQLDKKKSRSYNHKTIYILRSPIDGRIHYVGAAFSRAFKHRMKMHIQHGRFCMEGTPVMAKVSYWIASLLKKDLYPIVEILEERVPHHVADFRERTWAYYFYFNGEPLKNIAHINKIKRFVKLAPDKIYKSKVYQI